MDEMIRETENEMVTTDAMVTTDDVTTIEKEESKGWTPAQYVAAVGVASLLSGAAIAATAIVGTKLNEYLDMTPLERAEYKTEMKKERLDLKLAKAKAKAEKKAAKMAEKNKGEDPEKKGGD